MEESKLRFRLIEMLEIYGTASQSLWRSYELAAIENVLSSNKCSAPILEIGCGDGLFSSKVFPHIDTAIDSNQRAVERSRVQSKMYGRVLHMDARAMQFDDNTFRTIFANSVLEHIPSLESVLAHSFRILVAGGLLITTVPLIVMNDFLVMRSSWYAELRRRQLHHVNLWESEKWLNVLSKIGFSRIELYPYLPGSVCRIWDRLDAPLSVGYGRYRISAIPRYGYKPLPAPLRHSIYRMIAKRLSTNVQKSMDVTPCAMVIVATK